MQSIKVVTPNNLYILRKKRIRQQRRTRLKPYMFLGIRNTSASRKSLFSAKLPRFILGKIRSNLALKTSSGPNLDRRAGPLFTSERLGLFVKPRTKKSKLLKHLARANV